jgi:hypothetical protein
VLVIFFFLGIEAGDRGQFCCPGGTDVLIVKTQQSLPIVWGRSLPWPRAVGMDRLDSSVAGCGGDSCKLLTLACRYWSVRIGIVE